MADLSILKNAFNKFSGMTGAAFDLSSGYWDAKIYRKGEFFNESKDVCKHLGFVVNGIFRAYYVNDLNGEEKNVFFYTANQVIVSYRSFVSQTPCHYFTEAMTDAAILHIHYENLMKLYEGSHEWERFGRFVAEKAFDLAMARTEGFLFLSPGERYLNLLKEHPDIFNSVPLYHIASYLDIKGPSLSRIRKRLASNAMSVSH